MAISDEIQLVMPTEADRQAGKPLDYKEAVLLTNPVSNPAFKVQVDDKYEYTLEKTNLKLKGWIADKEKIGWWIIAPSDEYMNGGPMKNELTCHCGPTCVVIFTSIHTFGLDLITEYRNGEPWKKVFGPIFIYLNADGDRATLWKDAKARLEKEKLLWPYDFVQHPDYLPASQRGTVCGQLLVNDIYVPGVVGTFRHPQLITVKPGDNIKLGQVTFKPPRNGPTVWDIGIPDRSANEFFVPDVDPKYRQYGLWARYREMYPKGDLVFNVGTSKYDKDWFFEHVLRWDGKIFAPAIWKVNFDLPEVIPGDYTLQMALAAAQMTNTFVFINDANAKRAHFSTGTVGTDNAIARHGNHGMYRFFNGTLPSTLFVKGKNTMFLRPARSSTYAFSGVMYDYIRLEAPPTGPKPPTIEL
ncbi:Rhamnogalacturonate lyase [Linum perenne]